jgi:ribosomal protein S12 methylthiotransferase accessory factor
LLNSEIPKRYARHGPPPAEALARLMKMRDAMGITRIADITGLDRIGIPVMQVVRPFSLSNAVSQGKGADTTAAAISAILESAEACFAERVSNFDIVIASADSLQVPPGRFDKYLLEAAPPDWRAKDITWVAGIDLLSGDSRPVPFELVHTAYVIPPLPHDGLFAGSTTGLAAALAEEDAIVHGILECIERDAIARAHRTHGFFQRCRIETATIDDPAVCQLLEKLLSQGLLIGLWHAPSPTGVPVIWCHLMERDDSDALLPYPADGSAASFDPAAAIAHAVFEAAQTRLAAISGARDDITRASYPKYPDRRKIEAHRRLLTESPYSLDYYEVARQVIDTRGDARSALLSRLAGEAIGNVLVIRIDTAPVHGLAVAKVVIPGLEPLLEG